jgi:hypothetical protein
MSDAQLREELLKTVASEANLRADQLLELARKKFDADEFAVREALWYLISHNMVELTADRTLRTPRHKHVAQAV